MSSLKLTVPGDTSLPLSDDCSYYIEFPKFKTISCDQPNRVAFFDPEKTNNRVRVVEYAVLIGDIRDETNVYSSSMRIFLSTSLLFYSIVVFFTYGFEDISDITKFTVYGGVGVLFILLGIFINCRVQKSYRQKISQILNEYNQAQFHRRGLHWDTEFKDQGWLRLRLNFQPTTGEFVPISNLILIPTNTFCLEMEDGNELCFSDGKFSDVESKKSLLRSSSKQFKRK